MAANRKPLGLRPKGLAGLDDTSTVRLAGKIAYYQREVELADPAELRQMGVEAFRQQREQEIGNRALAVALFGVERCAGCRFFYPRDSYHSGLCRRMGPKIHRPNDTKATEWCGRHEPVLAGGA